MTSLRERAQAVFPAGCNGEFNLPRELATVIARGEGCRLWDGEGRAYLDFSMGWGSALVGHARPEVTEAAARQAEHGANFAYVTEASLELAEDIVRLSPACERVRLCASGSEATLYCLRLARAFTGRPKVLKFEGAYHGAHDLGVASLVPAQPPDFPVPAATGDGLAPGLADAVLVAPFNDLEATRAIVARHAAELAAVIVEPLQRCTPPVAGFLAGLRDLTREHGVLLVFDEVVTGFRLAYAGAQEYYGVAPDLVAFGKALGGGYPIGAYGGRADVMDLVREDRMGRATYVWTASSLGGNPVSSAAARAALAVYAEAGTYEHLHRLGAELREGMRRILAARGHAAQVIGDGPLAQVLFTAEPVHNYRDARKADAAKGRAVMLGLFERGIFLNPMGTKLYLSLAHDGTACDGLLACLDDVLRDLG